MSVTSPFILGPSETWGQLLLKSNKLLTITLENVLLNYNYMAFEQSN